MTSHPLVWLKLKGQQNQELMGYGATEAPTGEDGDFGESLQVCEAVPKAQAQGNPERWGLHLFLYFVSTAVAKGK